MKVLVIGAAGKSGEALVNEAIGGQPQGYDGFRCAVPRSTRRRMSELLQETCWTRLRLTLR